jgi:hypothetical protein
MLPGKSALVLINPFFSSTLIEPKLFTSTPPEMEEVAFSCLHHLTNPPINSLPRPLPQTDSDRRYPSLKSTDSVVSFSSLFKLKFASKRIFIFVQNYKNPECCSSRALEVEVSKYHSITPLLQQRIFVEKTLET